jgi:putative cell wall-binding protein
VLLTGAGPLDPAVAREVARLGARNAYLVGRPDQVSPQVDDGLRAAGVTASARLEAPDPYSLSAMVANELRDVLVDRGAPAPQRALLALGEADDPSRSWPDALSASALAAHTRTPILLTRPDALPAPVRDLLAAQRPSLVQVVGGPVAIPDAVAAAAGGAARGSWRRLSGLTRYGTSVAVAKVAVAAGLTAPIVWVATGRNYPDALAAGPAAARAGAPLLLIDGMAPGGSPESDQWLAAEAARLDDAVLSGGVAALSDSVAARVSLLLGG